jgi:hypothetical protein
LAAIRRAAADIPICTIYVEQMRQTIGPMGVISAKKRFPERQ